MSDRRFARTGIRELWTSLVGAGPLADILRHSIFFQDPPDHGRLRSVIAATFAPRAVRRMEDRLAQIVDELLAPVMGSGEMDAINDLAYPLALTVMAEVIGLPVADRDQFRAWSLAVAPTLDLASSAEEIARGQAAMREFDDYLRALIPLRERDPGDDLLSGMLAARTDAEDPPISVEEIISMVITLVFAGHDTTTNLVGNGILAFARNPEQVELLRRDPDLIPNAVEECLRFDPPVQANSRQVREPVQVGDEHLRPGEVVVMLAGAANRDPALFDEPDRFDVTREGIQTMSFGAGMRFCVGAVLARLEATAAFRRVTQLREIRLTVPESDLEYQRSTMFRGLRSLPVAFTAPAGFG